MSQMSELSARRARPETLERWLVEGLLPQGEVSLLGADGGTGKGIWQAQLVAYITAGKTSTSQLTSRTGMSSRHFGM